MPDVCIEGPFEHRIRHPSGVAGFIQEHSLGLGAAHYLLEEIVAAFLLQDIWVQVECLLPCGAPVSPRSRLLSSRNLIVYESSKMLMRRWITRYYSMPASCLPRLRLYCRTAVFKTAVPFLCNFEGYGRDRELDEDVAGQASALRERVGGPTRSH